MTFDIQAVMQNDDVRLRPLQRSDFESLFAIASDPLIWEQHPASDRYKRDVFQRFFDGGMDSGGAYVIFDAVSGEMIGSTRYCFHDPVRSEIEIGWTFLRRSHWGGPYNRAVKRLMVNHALRAVKTVILRAGPDNHRSCRAIEKIGGRLDGTIIDDDGRVNCRYVVTTPLAPE